MRCIICGLSKDASKEHIIPEALGNEKFITFKVCRECNNRLGTNVDNYLTDYIIIKLIRKDLNLLGKNENEIKIFPGTVTDSTGEKFLFKNDVPIPAPKVNLEDGILHIEAETIDEGMKLAKKKLERCNFSNEKINEIIKNYDRKEPVRYKPSFQLPADLDKGRYLLAGIKIAYEFACETLVDSYFDDKIAQLLRKELHNAAYSEKKRLSNCVDYSILSKYASLSQLPGELKIVLDKLKSKLSTPARHVCILCDSADHKLICHVILLFEDFMSFTVMLSEDAVRYRMKGECKIAVILEDGSCLCM